MRYLGRFQLGDYVPLQIGTHPGTAVAANPTAAPTARIVALDTPGSAVETVNMAIRDAYKRTGFFLNWLRLSSSYSAKIYAAYYTWAIAGSNYSECDMFEVVAGGNSSGAVIGAAVIQRPEAEFLMYQLDDGTLNVRRNPV